MKKNFKEAYSAAQTRVHDFKNRRPHRSFRLTRRRDYARSLKLPGLIASTHASNKLLWKNRKTFAILGAIYAVLTVALIGIASQETYTTLTSTLNESGSEVFAGNLGQIGQAAIVFGTIATSGLTESPTEAQQVYTVILVLLVWLTTVWLLRNILAGYKVKTRDGLYNAGTPLVSTFLVALMIVVQLLPVGIAALGYSAASATGLLSSGVEAMLFWIAAALLTILSLYWVMGSLFALIVVTIPGMYPMRALRLAGDMMVGRRLRILGRIAWMGLMIALTWIAVLIPIILIDNGLKHVWAQMASVPLIPVVILVLGTWTVIWSSTYIYLLYRKVVDDDAEPA